MWKRLAHGRSGLHTFLGVLAIGLVLAGTAPALLPGQAAVAAEPDEFTAFGDQLERVYRAARATMEDLPWEQFHLNVRQQTIGNDADALFAWVRDHTRWAGYRGTLRGARGTLMDRTGSHLDRALLLAALLEAAGHEVRLAHAELSDAEADALKEIATVSLPGEQPTEATNAADAEAADPDELYLSRMSRVLGVEAGALRQSRFEARLEAQQMSERVVEQGLVQSEALAQVLGWEQASPAAEQDMDAAAALADHWWVQMRTEEGWLDLDPARRSHEAGDRIHEAEAFETYTMNDLPSVQHHTLRIEVIAEQLDEDGGLHEHVALAHEASAADLSGQVIAIAAEPTELPDWAALLGADEDRDAESLPDEVLAQQEWLPVLNIGGELIADQVIVATGELTDQPAPLAEARAMEDATGALGALSVRRNDDEDAEQEATHLTAVFVRFTIEAPGREPERFERSLMDVMGPARRAADTAAVELNDALREQRAVAMLGTMRVMGQAGWIPESFATGRALETMLQNRSTVLGALHAMNQANAAQLAAAAEGAIPHVSDLLVLAHQRQAMSPDADALVLTRLNLLSHTRQARWHDGQVMLTDGFDIIQNAVDVLPGADVTMRQARLRQGVLETVLEAELLETDEPVMNTSRRYAQALARGENWRVVQEASQLEGSFAEQIDPDTHAHLHAALASGQVIVLPEHIEAGDELMWWRVDADSGVALGVGPDGRGQAAVEYAVDLLDRINTAFGVANTIVSMWSCLIFNAGDNTAIECCARREAFKTLVSSGMGIAASGLHTLDRILFGHLFDAGLDKATPNPC